MAERSVEELKGWVIAFAAMYCPKYAADHGMPLGHLHPDHYDILADCGARMNGSSSICEHGVRDFEICEHGVRDFEICEHGVRDFEICAGCRADQ